MSRTRIRNIIVRYKLLKPKNLRIRTPHIYKEAKIPLRLDANIKVNSANNDKKIIAKKNKGAPIFVCKILNFNEGSTIIIKNDKGIRLAKNK